MLKLKHILISIFILLGISVIIITSVLYFNNKNSIQFVDNKTTYKVVFEGVEKDKPVEISVYKNNILKSSKIPKAMKKDDQIFIGWKEKNNDKAYFDFEKTEITKQLSLTPFYLPKNIYEDSKKLLEKDNTEKDKYTKESIEKLQKAFKDFEKINKNKKISPLKKEKAYNNLKKAYESLILTEKKN